MKNWIFALIVGLGVLSYVGRPVVADRTFGSSVSNLMENYSHYVPKGSLQMFVTAHDARYHCENDPVVWVDTETHTSYLPSTPEYGRTRRGGYACEHEAISAGDSQVQHVEDQHV